jgi:hypothetical protein
MLRELGSLERGLTRTDLYAPFNVVSVARISGPLQADTLRAALDHLQARHTLLNVRIEHQGGRFWFAASNGGPIQLEILPRAGDDAWLAAVEAELGKRISTQTGPLLRCVFLPPSDDRRGEIILTYHHSIMDGTSSIVLWRELLETGARLMARPGTAEPVLGPLPPALEELFPLRNRGPRRILKLLSYGLAQSWDEATYTLRMLQKPRPRVHDSVRSQVISIVLEQALTESFAYRCRQRGISINSALHAALLLAANRRLYGGQSLLMRTFSFADMRSSLAVTIPEDQLGVYIALMRYTFPLAGSAEYWTLAQRVHQRMYRSLKSGDRYGAAGMIEFLVRLLTRTRLMRFANTALSYGGPVPLTRNHGDLELQELHAFLSGFDLSPEVGSGAIIFDDRLIWDIVYLDKDMEPPAAQALAEELQRILAEAAG